MKQALESTRKQHLLRTDSRHRSIRSTSINEHPPVLTCVEQRRLGRINSTSTIRLECIEDMTKHLAIHILSPQKVEVLICRDRLGDCTTWQALKHDVDIDETVTTAVQEHDWCLDVSGRVFDRLIESLARDDAEGGVSFVVEELEVLVADHLEPMDDGFGTGEGVQVEICG